ncbi:4-hydroxybenzoate polyprenyl transferase [Suillus paluster]|uniref:4-hydroxybenzoate polyprenyl transferase n=1 Tax=Suillus paluster TaxID=48578 RepID=UPI001B861FA7|nr:4-hydroxybenzoate polyprenyl transferase [Suillus paluster]KAG1752698.1 4-hydroxybenzoate polyprenyl transferase [Suillus paluster]
MSTLSVQNLSVQNEHRPKQSSAPATTWVNHLPSSIRPYLYLIRADKPAAILLLFYPCAWSVTMTCYALSAPITTAWTYVGFFLLASFVFRSAGCVINDMWDRHIDAAVSRTRTRPLAAGDITRLQAFIFLIPLLALGIWLFMQLNEYSTALGLSSLGLVVLYPAMKRVTDWPQAVLALCFNWGALLGAASIAGAVDWKVYIPLYVGAACWTIEYDTSYARQDRDDDMKNGNHSTTIIFGDRIRPILLMFSIFACSLVAYAGILNGHGFPYFIGVALGALHLVRFIAKIDFEDKKSCNDSLHNNLWFGFCIWAGAMADYILKMQS